jgi:hypothetical protein
VIDEEHLELAAVAGVDESGRVQHRHALLHRQSGAGQHEAGVTSGNGHGETGGNQAPLAGLEPRELGGAEIEAGVSRLGIGR